MIKEGIEFNNSNNNNNIVTKTVISPSNNDNKTKVIKYVMGEKFASH